MIAMMQASGGAGAMNPITMRIGLAVAMMACVFGAARPAHGELIFSATAHNNLSPRTGTQDPVTFISSVAQNTEIGQIGILDQLSTSGQVRFLIYDATTSNLAYFSTPETFAADSGSSSWKLSDSLSFTLLAGHKYYIGGVADVANLAAYQFPPTSVAQNGITSGTTNAVFGYDGTLINTTGGAAVPLELFKANPAVPEPSTLISGGLGAVAGVAYAWRRRRMRAVA